MGRLQVAQIPISFAPFHFTLLNKEMRLATLRAPDGGRQCRTVVFSDRHPPRWPLVEQQTQVYRCATTARTEEGDRPGVREPKTVNRVGLQSIGQLIDPHSRVGPCATECRQA